MRTRKKLPAIAYIGITGIVLGISYVSTTTLLPSYTQSTVEAKSYGNESKQITVLGDTFSGYSTFRTNSFGETIAQADLGIQYRNEVDQASRVTA